MLGRLLKRHSNYNEYWVCAVCGRPRRRNTSRSKPCKFCRADEPPRIRITEKKGKGDKAHQDSRNSKALFAAAVYARKGLGLDKGNFPQQAPAREFLATTTEHEPNKRSRRWFCQVFIDGDVYKGETDNEICLYTIIPEVGEHMTGKKMMQIRITSDLHKWLKLYAAQNDTTMTTIIIQYLERLRQKNSKKVQVDQI